MTHEPKETTPPALGEGARRAFTLQTPSGPLAYTAVADWITLHEHDKPIASVFFTGYFAQEVDPATRPITFVFNGGPGASSVYLHLGLVGPRRVAFTPEGGVAPPPVQLVDNPESWLSFTDIVCIDPVGTGFSRTHEPRGEGDKPTPSRFWEVERDLKSFGEVIRRVLSAHGRWASPVVLAGESYGGYRVARLAKSLQEDMGVGLTAALLISPGIELNALLPTDYTLDHYVDLLPSLASTAHAHGRAGVQRSAEAHRHAAERFATTRYVQLLAQGQHMPEAERAAVCQEAAELIGLPLEEVQRSLGRVDREQFCRALLRAEQRFVGRYDGTQTTVDPFPHRAEYAGPDISLGGGTPTFTAGINHHLRAHLGVKTELEYTTLNLEANEAWTDKGLPHYISVVGASMDALRYGMALNPHMKVLISHGHHDLVTPYASADRLARLLKLAPSEEGQLRTQHFSGGHMFYSHPGSRVAFTQVVRRLLG